MRILKLTLAVKLVIFASINMGVSHAATNPTIDNDTPSTELGALTVTTSADASKEGLMPAFEGGQVATGSRVGILGNQENLSTPFSTVAYTNDYIQNQQAQSVGDVLKKDPTVRVARGFGNFQETYYMRGFLTNSDETLFNGLYGVLPRQYIASELFERVEVQRGASAALNGASSSGGNIGGTISLLPKRAGNDPLKRVTVSTENGENAKVALDIGQRFGAHQEYGVRANVAYQDGGSAIDDEEKQLGLAALGVDYRGDKTRVSADIGYQNNELSQTRPAIVASSFVPKPIDGTHNWAKPWTFSNEKDLFGTLRAEYDITDNLTTYAAAGYLDGEEKNSLASLFYLNAKDGSGNEYRFDNTRDNKIITGEVGIKGQHKTGAVSHNWVVSANSFKAEEKGAGAWGAFTAANLYQPTNALLTTTSSFATDTETKTSSVAIADNLGFFNDKLTLLLAGRYQTIETASAGATTYDDSEFTPSFGMTHRLTPTVSTYANYNESLAKGTYIVQQHNAQPVTNGDSFSNPYISKQSEVGIKYDNGLLGASLSGFSTKKPNYDYRANADASYTFIEQGEDKHTGVELTVFGSPSNNTRFIGGMTYIKAEQGNTANAGKRVIGVPEFQANVGLEYDVNRVDGLTLTGDINHTGDRYADGANTLKVDGFTTLDVGARYTTKFANKPVTIKGVVSNITDEKYWGSVGGYPGSGYLTVGEPRTLKLSASFDF